MMMFYYDVPSLLSLCYLSQFTLHFYFYFLSFFFDVFVCLVRVGKGALDKESMVPFLFHSFFTLIFPFDAL